MKLIYLIGISVLLLSKPSWGELVTYPFTSDIESNSQFKVKVNNKEVQVYNGRVCSETKFRPRGHFNASKVIGFASFDMSEPVHISIEVTGIKLDSVNIKPARHQIQPTVQGQNISFDLKKPAYLVVELNESVMDHLYIYANPLEMEKFSKNDPNVLYFGPGIHQADQISVSKNNQTVYLAGGAYVYGCINAKGVENLKIKGRGILSAEKYITKDGSTRVNTILIKESKNIEIEGPVLVDAANSWQLKIEDSWDVKVRNLKEIAFTQNTDGIDPVSSKNVHIENVFIRNYDDGVVVKTLAEPDSYTENIFTTNCVIITDFASSLKIGNNELLGKSVKNVQFVDCDILSCRGHPIAVTNGGSAEVSDVRFENIRIDGIRAFGFQEKDKEIHLIGLNVLHRNVYMKRKNQPYTSGSISNVLIKDVTYQSKRPHEIPKISIIGYDESGFIKNVRLVNVQISGQKITSSDGDRTVVGKCASEVTFE